MYFFVRTCIAGLIASVSTYCLSDSENQAIKIRSKRDQAEMTIIANNPIGKTTSMSAYKTKFVCYRSKQCLLVRYGKLPGIFQLINQKDETSKTIDNRLLKINKKTAMLDGKEYEYWFSGIISTMD